LVQENTDMTTQLTSRPLSQSVKTAGMWCVLSLGSEGLSASYLGGKNITSHQASVFSTRNPRPEADHRAALD